jgi:hypothetical protein
MSPDASLLQVIFYLLIMFPVRLTLPLDNPVMLALVHCMVMNACISGFHKLGTHHPVQWMEFNLQGY